MSILRSSGRIKPDTQFPFTVINKIATSLVQLNSFGTREEESFYQFETYALDRKEVRRICDAIRERYDYSSLHAANRRILGIIWNGMQFSELQSGIFCGKVRYQILAEKDITEQSNLSPVTGGTFLECLYKRYLNSSKLKNLVNGFYLSNYGRSTDEFPIITSSDFVVSEAWRHTKGQVEQYDFSLQIWGVSAEQVELIKEEIMNEYDYINMSIDNRIFYSMQYQGDTLLEADSGIWTGEVDYQLLTEKSLGS